MNTTQITEIIAGDGWGTYGTLVVAILTLLVNLHQSYKSKMFGMKCYECCEMVYDVDYKAEDRNVTSATLGSNL